jgi:hypothetical protein
VAIAVVTELSGRQYRTIRNAIPEEKELPSNAMASEQLT